MINNQNIKGEYFFDINMYTMFGVYNICTKNNNLITDNGISFFLNKCVNQPTITYDDDSEEYKLEDEYGYIGFIAVGESQNAPDKSNTSLENETNVFYENKVKLKGNEIILSVQTDGPSVNETSEIGVYTTSMILISRDVHSPYVLPSTSTVNLTYKFTLNQSIEPEEEEE